MKNTKELKRIVEKFCIERSWDNQPPGDVAKSIVIEAAELLEHFQWISFFDEDPTKDPNRKKEIIDELADVLIYCIEMSIILDCDVSEIVINKLKKAAIKYPAGKQNQLGSTNYRKIKQTYRAKQKNSKN